MNTYEHLEAMTPLLMQLELTEACNLKCQFCYNSQQPRYNKNVYRVLDLLAEQGVMQLTLTGGEPLMHPDFFGILAHAEKLFPNVMILSNGVLMTEEVVQKIAAHNVMSVCISIHGDQKTHDLLTGVHGSYAKAIEAIKLYLKNGSPPIASNFVLNALNMHLLEETANFFKQIGLQFMTITRFVPVGTGKNARHLEISPEDIVSAMRFADQFMKDNSHPHIEFAEAVPFCAVPDALQHLANTCSYGYDRFYIDVEGNMMVCGLSRIPLGGNILEEAIVDIKKKSTAFQSFMKNEHVPGTCVACHDFSMCHGGCRAAAMRDGQWCGTQDSLMVK